MGDHRQSFPELLQNVKLLYLQVSTVRRLSIMKRIFERKTWKEICHFLKIALESPQTVSIVGSVSLTDQKPFRNRHMILALAVCVKNCKFVRKSIIADENETV